MGDLYSNCGGCAWTFSCGKNSAYTSSKWAYCQYASCIPPAFPALQGTKIKINRCRTIDRAADKGLAFSFCKGTTLETLLDACLAAADMDGFRKWITEYMEWLYYRETEFTISNLDFIFPNIIVDGEDWHIIDYEWTFENE